MLNSNLIEAPVLNDRKERIGTNAYITVPQEVLLENVSMDDVAEFYQSFQGKGYNWVSILCPEGTGLVFPGAGKLASYGKLDKEGRLTDDIYWSIIYDETVGTFKEFKHTQQPVTQARSDNILMNTALIEAPVVNGFNQRIGTRAYITLPQEILLEVVSLEDVTEFYWSFQGKGYNWVSIICPEGTGLVFGGAGPMASYGKVDELGRMDGDTHWVIIYDETIGNFRGLKF
ncbi:MAG: hypothetical protein LBR93_11730 [Treponema sp.]|nr:hypothetical protein [Treponema sp.]